MSNRTSLLERLKRSRIVQVLVVYLGGSWVVLQLADLLTETAGLPPWVRGLTLLLVAVGLVIVLATAWVQSLPSTTAAEEAGERPTDWEVAPGDALARLKAGTLPHLTWGRAVLVGLMALAVLFGGAGTYVLLKDGEGVLAPEPVDAEEVATGVAVLPFSVSGAELGLYREGMVDLLSTTLDGLAGYRTIDSRTVLARWSESVGDDARPDLATSLRAAARTGARYVLLGSLVPAGSEVRLAVEIHDLDSARQVGTTQATGTPDSILALVDEVSVGVARELLGDTQDQLVSAQRVSSITTASLPALEDYLDGERLIRQGDFQGAVVPLERAVAADSTFALAWSRLAEAYGWAMDPVSQARAAAAMASAVRFSNRLSPREALLVRATQYTFTPTPDPRCAEPLEGFVRRYPDEAEGWGILAECHFHLHAGNAISTSRDSVVAWFSRALELDPGYAPYIPHLVDIENAAGHEAEARAWADRYAQLGTSGDLGMQEVWEVSLDLFSSDPQARARGLEAAERRTGAVGLELTGVTGLMSDFPAREVPVWRLSAQRDPSMYRWFLHSLWRAGRWHESSDQLGAPPPGREDEAALMKAFWHETYGLGDLETVHRAGRYLRCDSAPCLDRLTWRVRHGAHDGYATEAASVLAEMERAQATIRQAGDSAATAEADRTVRDARAWIALRTGDPASALAEWRGRIGHEATDFLGLATAAEASGDLALAERYYREQAWGPYGPFAGYRLGRLYERADRHADALAQYRRLVGMWEAADRDFPPLLEVREAIARLGG